VVLDSADVDFFGHTFMRSVFQNTGQNCIGIERYLVHSSLYSRFIEVVEPQIAALRPGSILSSSRRTDVGAMISPQSFDRLEHLIEDAVKKGARVRVGGQRYAHEEFPQGHYFKVCTIMFVVSAQRARLKIYTGKPTLIVDVTNDMEISQVELFAPVLLVMRFSVRLPTSYWL
jgi:acyl-CoA reductase-like NAD-dependent aldehyde dehydrogenase